MSGRTVPVRGIATVDGQKVVTVTITARELSSLRRDAAHLRELEARGVDNWEGYVGPPREGEGE